MGMNATCSLNRRCCSSQPAVRGSGAYSLVHRLRTAALRPSCVSTSRLSNWMSRRRQQYPTKCTFRLKNVTDCSRTLLANCHLPHKYAVLKDQNDGNSRPLSEYASSIIEIVLSQKIRLI